MIRVAEMNIVAVSSSGVVRALVTRNPEDEGEWTGVMREAVWRLHGFRSMCSSRPNSLRANGRLGLLTPRVSVPSSLLTPQTRKPPCSDAMLTASTSRSDERERRCTDERFA